MNHIFNFSADTTAPSIIRRKVTTFLSANNGHGAVVIRSELVKHPVKGLIREVEIRYNTKCREVVMSPVTA